MRRINHLYTSMIGGYALMALIGWALEGWPAALGIGFSGLLFGPLALEAWLRDGHRIKKLLAKVTDEWRWRFGAGRVVRLPNRLVTMVDTSDDFTMPEVDPKIVMPQIDPKIVAWLNENLPGRWRELWNATTDINHIMAIGLRSVEDEVLFRLAWSEQLAVKKFG